jgi:hypothetical protein
MSGSSLLTAQLCIRLAGLRRDWVEIYYSSSIYPLIGQFSRWLFGWLPFSAGDLGLYFRRGMAVIFTRSGHKDHPQDFISRRLYSGSLWLLKLCLVVYIGFNLLWGLNYNRKGIAWQMNLQLKIR